MTRFILSLFPVTLRHQAIALGHWWAEQRCVARMDARLRRSGFVEEEAGSDLVISKWVQKHIGASE